MVTMSPAASAAVVGLPDDALCESRLHGGRHPDCVSVPEQARGILALSPVAIPCCWVTMGGWLFQKFWEHAAHQHGTSYPATEGLDRGDETDREIALADGAPDE